LSVWLVPNVLAGLVFATERTAVVKVVVIVIVVVVVVVVVAPPVPRIVEVLVKNKIDFLFS
jgi:hypothetical protein